MDTMPGVRSDSLPCRQGLLSRSKLFSKFSRIRQQDAVGKVLAVGVGFFLLPLGAADPVRVERGGDGRHVLRVAGEPFRVEGAGGPGSMELLRNFGANSIRTWDLDDETQALLDEAHRNGLRVTLGFWLRHERHGFSYEDYEEVVRQERRLRRAVEMFRDHPALLMWALGNEMEGFQAGGSPAIWTQIEHLARIVKSLDPAHPVMTVTAEIGGDRVKALNRYCPSIDVHGINSYGAIETLPERYRKAGGTKPYLVTEFGVPGAWEVPPGPWGMPEEPTSTAKADSYRRSHEALRSDPLCLGSYAFLWGAKQESTATWFGMLLPDGTRLAAADVMKECWTGSPPDNRCPEILSLELAGGNRVHSPGEVVEVMVKARDPEDDPLVTEWRLSEDWVEISQGGDLRPAPPDYPDSIREPGVDRATISLPDKGGLFRVYAIVRDGHGGAATANLSLKVEGEVMTGESRKAALPLSVTESYTPSGWMGDTDKMKVTLDSVENPRVGDTCIKVTYSEPSGWGGIAWVSPAGDWGDRPGGWNLSGAEKLSFWARGEKGGEKARFGIGLIEEDKRFPDSFRKEITVELSDEWMQYEIPLRGGDLGRIKTGFYVVVTAKGLPFELFLDDILIE